jgi:hypothetical protein
MYRCPCSTPAARANCNADRDDGDDGEDQPSRHTCPPLSPFAYGARLLFGEALRARSFLLFFA